MVLCPLACVNNADFEERTKKVNDNGSERNRKKKNTAPR
jgi:hypothetical protein